MVQLDLFETPLEKELKEVRHELRNLQRALFARIGELKKEHEFLYTQVEILVDVIEKIPSTEELNGKQGSH